MSSCQEKGLFPLIRISINRDVEKKMRIATRTSFLPTVLGTHPMVRRRAAGSTHAVQRSGVIEYTDVT